MSEENVIQFPSTDTDKNGIGGMVEKSSVTLAIYGHDLVPNEITEILGVAPTRFFRRGEKTGRAGEHGAWFLTFKGNSPEGPAQHLERLLSCLNASKETWSDLSKKYDVQLRFVIRMFGYNRGFDINSALTQRLSEMGASLGFSIYSEDEEENA